eukprot:jgi/Galph1/4793/GphlegSOOS_G3453.1
MTTEEEFPWYKSTCEELENILLQVSKSQSELENKLEECNTQIEQLERTEANIVVGEGMEKLADARYTVNRTREKLENIVRRLERLHRMVLVQTQHQDN